MAGKSKKEMHPFIAELMTKLGCKNLTEMAKLTGVPLNTLRGYAFEGRIPLSFDTRLANFCGISPELLINELRRVNLKAS